MLYLSSKLAKFQNQLVLFKEVTVLKVAQYVLQLLSTLSNKHSRYWIFYHYEFPIGKARDTINSLGKELDKVPAIMNCSKHRALLTLSLVQRDLAC